MKILDNFQATEFLKSFHFAEFSEYLKTIFEEVLRTF